MKLILTTFIVCYGVLPVWPNPLVEDAITGRVNDGSKVQENFRHFFDSLTKNDMKKTGAYRNLLEQTAVKEEQAFHMMKDQLQSVRQKNALHQRNVYSKNGDIDRHVGPFKRETSEKPKSGAYIIPAVKTENAIEAVTKLLDSQSTHIKEVDRLFRILCAKNKNHSESDLLEISIDRSIKTAYAVIDNSTKIIQECLKNGSVTDDLKKKPLSYENSRRLMESFKYVNDFINNYIVQFDLDDSEEIEAMQKPVDDGILEMEAYNRYLDVVNEGIEVCTEDDVEQNGFMYPRYGKLWEKNRAYEF